MKEEALPVSPFKNATFQEVYVTIAHQFMCFFTAIKLYVFVEENIEVPL